jgi:type I restriction enzyme S subunit
VTVKHLSVGTIKAIELLLPPLPEQKRIAGILDKADALRRKRQQALQLTDQFLRATFLDMFGDPIKNEKGWPTKVLCEVASVNRGKFTPRPRNDPRFYGGHFPFIQTGDIANSNTIVRSWSQTLNDEGIKVSRSFPRGTIVIAIVGATIGETAILGFDAYAPDSVIGIQPKEDQCTAEYVEYLLRYWKPILRDRAPETARANINLDTLRPLPVPMAPLDDQKKFSRVYRIAAAQPRKPAALLDDLFHSLIQRAFRGEL